MRKEFETILTMGEKLINIQKITNVTSGMNVSEDIRKMMTVIKREIVNEMIETYKSTKSNKVVEKQVSMDDVIKSEGVTTTNIPSNKAKKPVPKK